MATDPRAARSRARHWTGGEVTFDMQHLDESGRAWEGTHERLLVSLVGTVRQGSLEGRVSCVAPPRSVVASECSGSSALSPPSAAEAPTTTPPPRPPRQPAPPAPPQR